MTRDYQKSDFAACQTLVNKVWEFDSHFHPPALSKLFQKIYTGGSLAASNFSRVVDEKGQVKGFLFGKIENKKIPKSEYSGFSGQLKIIFSLFFIPKVTFKAKLAYLNKINTHEINRRTVESRKCSEVNLFVVDPACQGEGWGRRLINEFIEACSKENINRIVLETDSESNLGFYQHLGFNIKGSFHSPLLQEFTGTTGKTYVYELYLNET